ncbi:Nucleotide-binding universal stress protein, UspA family [Halogranum amylolyticum]|uniref:Nucleotide-binding universal stress protein, UspA family n=1 Tax=Halogranum amylolyticum TaxID=660520 RepID=A0A1H8UDS1_9EURY|nr:universal stress protein [Halogranum amylolyticum]SEP01177.1 Nucleotide-binding universal stress protein, UspA family [Halogranum amylolyticum]
MTTILLAIDTDVERAKEQVESVTTLPLMREDTRLIIYHVFRADGEGADARNLRSVSTAIEKLEDAGFEVEVRQSSGDVVRGILDEAERIDADIISLAGRKRSPTKKALFGSVSQDVLLKSERAVLFETTTN